MIKYLIITCSWHSEGTSVGAVEILLQITRNRIQLLLHERFPSILLYFFFLVLLIGIFRGQHALAHYWELKQSKAVLEKTVTELQANNKKLEEEIHKIRSSVSYAAKVLRDKYHVTESNETIVFFAD